MTADLVTTNFFNQLKISRAALHRSLTEAHRFSKFGLTAHEAAYAQLLARLDADGVTVDSQEDVALKFAELDGSQVAMSATGLREEVQRAIDAGRRSRDFGFEFLGHASFDQEVIDNPILAPDETFKGDPSVSGQANLNRRNFAFTLEQARLQAGNCKVFGKLLSERLDYSGMPSFDDPLDTSKATLLDLERFSHRVDALMGQIDRMLRPVGRGNRVDPLTAQTWLIAEMERAESEGGALCIPAVRPVNRVDDFVEVFVPLYFDQTRGELSGFKFIAIGAHAVPIEEATLSMADLFNGSTPFLEKSAFVAARIEKTDDLAVDELAVMVAKASHAFRGPSDYRFQSLRYLGHLRQFADREAREGKAEEFVGKTFLRARESLVLEATKLQQSSLEPGTGLDP